MRQSEITKNLGRDTHVRDNTNNMFTRGNHETNQLIIGEVLMPEPEPAFKQNMVTVKLARGGRVTSVAMPNAGINPVFGKLHGLHEGLIPGQMVMLGFENGNQASPFIVNRYPYQGTGNSFFESSFIMPTVAQGIGNADVAVGHFSGSSLQFHSGIFPDLAIPGSVTLDAITSLQMSGMVSAKMSALMGGAVECDVLGNATISSLLGATVSADTTGLVSIKSLTQSMGDLVQTLITVISGLVTTNCVVGAPVVLNPATIALLTAEKIKWLLLLKS
jgi:hypothetical protein